MLIASFTTVITEVERKELYVQVHGFLSYHTLPYFSYFNTLIILISQCLSTSFGIILSHFDLISLPLILCQVNYGSLSSLLDRLVNVSYFGLDFLNTFLMTFRLFTSADVVMKYLLDKFHDSIQKRSNRASCSSTGSADDTGLEHRSTCMLCQ